MSAKSKRKKVSAREKERRAMQGLTADVENIRRTANQVEMKAMLKLFDPTRITPA